MQVEVERDAHGDWIVKTASSAAEAARLAHEEAQLRQAAHPGVVEVGSFRRDDPVELRTRHAGRPLSELTRLADEEVSGLGAAVATVLADLHDLGVVHGAVGADHILVGADGRPVLCGFGDSGRTEQRDPAVDVRSLAAMLSDRLAPGGSARLAGLLRRTGGGRRRPPSARAFAAALGAATAHPRLPAVKPAEQRAGPAPGLDCDLAAAAPGHAPTPGDGSPLPGAAAGGAPALTAAPSAPPTSAPRSASRRRDRQPRRRRTAGALVAAAALAVAGVLTAAAVGVLHRPAGTRVPCPATDRGCVPLIVRHGVFVTASGTFAIAIAEPVIVLGRWSCGRTALPAALDRRTGRLWSWRSWAGPSNVATAEAVATIPGARSLRVLPEPSGCDVLQVVGADGRTTVMPPGGHGG